MWAMTRSGQLVAECERVERCLYVNLLFRLRWVLGETGDEAKAWEEDMVQHLLLYHCYRSDTVPSAPSCTKAKDMAKGFEDAWYIHFEVDAARHRGAPLKVACFSASGILKKKGLRTGNSEPNAHCQRTRCDCNTRLCGTRLDIEECSDDHSARGDTVT